MEISPSQHGAPTRSQQDSTRGEARLSKPTYLPEDLTAELEIRVRALYADKSVLPQHNFEHVLQVREAVKPLIERCEKAGIPIDRVALDHAILLHDLLYAVDHQKLGFESKEALSADYAEKLLLELGAPLEHARKVKEIILATHHQKEPQTPEEILIRAADLSNLAGDYKSFRATTHRLHEESRINGNAGISFQEFVVRSYRFLSFFTASQLELTDGARTSDGKSEWHENVFSNLQRLHAEAFGTEEQSVLVIVGREALDRVMLEPPRAGNTFCVYCPRDESEGLLPEGVHSRLPVVLLAPPLTKGPISVPDNFCDLLVVDSDTFNEREQELSEILFEGGKLKRLQ